MAYRFMVVCGAFPDLGKDQVWVAWNSPGSVSEVHTKESDGKSFNRMFTYMPASGQEWEVWRGISQDNGYSPDKTFPDIKILILYVEATI